MQMRLARVAQQCVNMQDKPELQRRARGCVPGVLAFWVWWFGLAGAGATCCVVLLVGRVVGGAGGHMLASTGAGYMCNTGASEPQCTVLRFLSDSGSPWALFT